MKKFITLLLLLSMVLGSVIACTESPDDKQEDTTEPATEPVTTESADGKVDGLYVTDMNDMELTQWTGTEFVVRSVELANARMQLDFTEISDDPVDLEVYNRTAHLEEKMGIDFVEIVDPDYYSTGFTSLDTLVAGGDDTYYLANVRCIESINYWSSGNIIPFDQLSYVNLEKGYWAQDLNPELTIINSQYIAVGAADLNVYDFMFTLLFNKKLVEDQGMPNFYDLVSNGDWTVDKMEEVMQNSYWDNNFNDTMDASDNYGYLADNRMVLPHFWVSCESNMVYKDENDYPQLNFSNEKFYDIFTRVFEIMWDQECWFSKYTGDNDVPSQCINMFAQNQALFLDCSFNFVPNLRNMEANFGIIPYPKWDKEQEQYHSRVSYFFSCVVPITCKDPDLSGAVLELMNCYSANYVIPAYYDKSLRSRDARDEESQAMLDIIFYNRVADLGDTTFCVEVRDGVFAGVFGSNNRNMSSIQRQEKAINKKIEKFIEGAEKNMK